MTPLLLLLVACGPKNPSGLSNAQVEDTAYAVKANVDGLKTAELAFDAAFDRFVPCGDEATARQQVSPEIREWPFEGCWAELGWIPDAPTSFGGYWIEVSEDGQDFTIHAYIDADGDGQVAELKATKDTPATWTSPEGVR